jgi:hypothetical protein
MIQKWTKVLAAAQVQHRAFILMVASNLRGCWRWRWSWSYRLVELRLRL